MANVIAICDQYKNKEKLNLLVNELNIDKVILCDEVDEENLNEFKIILFVLNPYYIGNEFFINKVKEITKLRKNTKSIMFAIDGKENLEKRELMKLKLEIESSLENLIDNPKVYDVSINLAVENKKYLIKSISLDDIRRNKEISYVDEEGFLVSGNDIKEEHVYKFRELSNIELLINNIEETMQALNNKDISKSSWCIVGSRNSGKSTMINNIRYLNKSIDIIEIDNIENINLSGSEGIIVLLDLNMEENIKLLQKVKNIDDNYKKVVILNRIDELMYMEETAKEFTENIKNYAKRLLREEVIFMSNYYAQKWLELKEGNIKVDEVMLDSEIVLLDKFSIPILTFINERKFLDEFEKQNYINKLKEVEKRLCLNHLQK